MNSHLENLDKDKISAEIARLEKTLPDGVSLTSLSKSCGSVLDEYTNLWLRSRVECLDKNSLSEASLTLQRQRTENTLTGDLLKTDIDSLEKELKRDQEDIEMLEKFLGGLKERNPEELRKEQISLEKKWQDLNQKTQQGSLSINLDELIRKVEVLETHSRGGKGK